MEVITGARAKNLTEDGLEVSGQFIPCRVKIWAAGNTASALGQDASARRSIAPGA